MQQRLTASRSEFTDESVEAALYMRSANRQTELSDLTEYSLSHVLQGSHCGQQREHPRHECKLESQGHRCDDGSTCLRTCFKRAMHRFLTKTTVSRSTSYSWLHTAVIARGTLAS
jgi:hypothetical protein